MTDLLWLSEAHHVAYQRLAGFRMEAAEWSRHIEPLQRPQVDDLDRFQTELERASSLLVTFPDIVVHEPWRSAVVQAVREGKRCLVVASDTELNPFLFEFDLAVHTGRLVAPPGSPGHERVIRVLGSDQPAHPLAQQLLRPDATLSAVGPSQAWCGATAQPFLVAPAGTRLLGAGDRFEPVPHGPLCCGGIWPRAGAVESSAPQAIGAGLVLLANGCLFDQPEDKVDAVELTGLSGLAGSLMCWLLGRRPWQQAVTRV